MSDLKKEIISRLSTMKEEESPNVLMTRFGWDNSKYDVLSEPVHQVMSSYQNANKWLDTIKEHLLINLRLPYFSNIVHLLAHTMPARFDKFGDILHTEDLLVPYPPTEEWTGPIGDVKNAISIIYDILDSIKDSLLSFQETVRGISPAMAISCDELIVTICSEYQFFIEVEQQLDDYSNLSQWDKYVYLYWKSKKELI